ncbi:hypothetical protein [Lysobacter niastensis]|uniref:Uncharacterized protein n=2 Tax=Lysobacter niastensis TaxID=380629 RepID=A0ABS0BBL1_9GAMM|nr:hypothetical protein [Lysobacter niastensis]MBF6025055.1 hypothetical protein [Lysobacter niastensis]MBF6025062.1 hypothetical protein [Lysobacter niastensis]
MDAASLALVVLGSIAVLAIAALPAWIAWLVAWGSHLPAHTRRSFMLVCLLLSFGLLTLTGGLLLPLEMAAFWIAPELHVAGHETAASTIAFASEHGVPVACLVVGAAASVIVPLKLRRSWPDVLSAISANNSFKGKPLRGSP